MMEKIIEEKNKALVLEAFNAAFNARDDSAYERYWSPDYIQHSAHIPPGREGLRGLIAQCPPDMIYESGLIMAEGEYVMVHGRFSNIGAPKAWVTLDIIRIENGLLAEHWDVIQDEASQSDSVSGLPMFGDKFSEA
jgi:predicted SnoaL-like aldol condensation-catalyzing enzyme